MITDKLRIVEKEKCIALHQGNQVIAALAGPDAKGNAEKIVAALSQQTERKPVAIVVPPPEDSDCNTASLLLAGLDLPIGAELYASPQPSAHVPEGWEEVLNILFREMGSRFNSDSRGNAPGHGHSVPGIWDSDNGELAGKACAWCAIYNKAKGVLTAAPSIAEKRGAIQVENYSAPGQINIGDLLLIDDGRSVYSARCQQICRENEDPEIVFNRKKNHFFITSMYLAGESWAKDVRIVRRPDPHAGGE